MEYHLRSAFVDPRPPDDTECNVHAFLIDNGTDCLFEECNTTTQYNDRNQEGVCQSTTVTKVNRHARLARFLSIFLKVTHTVFDINVLHR